MVNITFAEHGYRETYERMNAEAAELCVLSVASDLLGYRPATYAEAMTLLADEGIDVTVQEA